MSKINPHPAHGGSYALDPVTGKRTLIHQTLPALTAQEVFDGWTDGPNGRQLPPSKPDAEATTASISDAKKR